MIFMMFKFYKNHQWQWLVIAVILVGLVDWGDRSKSNCPWAVTTATLYDPRAITGPPPPPCPSPPPCHCPRCQLVVPPRSISERLFDLLMQGAGTVEVLFRGFSLGFGLRMLKYIIIESGGVDEDTSNESIQKRFWVSCISGLAMAAFIHGLSLFIPTSLRMHWFEYSDTFGDSVTNEGCMDL